MSTQRRVGRSLLSAVRHHVPDLTPSGLLRLEYGEQGDYEMPLVWITGQTLLYMWKIRQSGKVVDFIITRSVLESRINLLRETRHSTKYEKIKEIFDNML